MSLQFIDTSPSSISNVYQSVPATPGALLMSCEFTEQPSRCTTDKSEFPSFADVMGAPRATAPEQKEVASASPLSAINPTEKSDVSGAQINHFLSRVGSPLAGQGDMIRNAADQANISAPFLLGVGLVESNLGKIGRGARLNNVFNVDEGGKLKQYPSMEDGVKDAADTIARVNNDKPGVVYTSSFAANMRSVMHPEEQVRTTIPGYTAGTRNIISSVIRQYAN
jgi:hypothetical protein